MSKEIDYRAAGVDIEAGDQAVERIKGLARSTFRPEVLQELGGFGGLFALNTAAVRQPVLVAGCDGVGTKLKLAFSLDRHDTVGEDCVAMCVNDILVQGAEPLFFLDYLATGKLEPEKVEQIVTGVARGCRLASCALLGGETAEMPGFYPQGEYDLAGFAVGVVEKNSLVDGSAVAPGDLVIGLSSTGLHSNGYSLARKVLLEHAAMKLTEVPEGLACSLGEELLRPTRIYVPDVLPLLQQHKVKGMANITGGGLPGNLCRVIPDGLQASIDQQSWVIPPIFGLIKRLGPVRQDEMYRTFNMGIGFVLIAAPGDAQEITDQLLRSGVEAQIIGSITRGGPPKVLISD